MLLLFIACIIGGLCIGVYHELRALPRDCTRGAGIDTLASIDALNVSDVSDIHFTLVYAYSAICTALFIELYTDERDLVEKSVDESERTQETAEKAEDEYARDKE